MSAQPSELYAMMGLTKANARRRGHAVLWRRHAVRQVLYELGYTMDAIALMERNLFGTKADHTTISNSIDQPYHRLIESMKDEAKRYANHYGIPRNPDHVQPDPHGDKIRGVLTGMERIGGIPSAKSFWEQFQMRAMAALGLEESESYTPREVHWEINMARDPKPDDFTANLGRFMLRCEQMDRYSWWWCVYDGDEQVESGFRPTKEDAMRHAEQSYKNYRNSNNKEDL